MNKKLILGVFAIGIALLLALPGAPLASTTSVSVKELTENPQKYQGEKIKVTGVISEETVEQIKDGTTFTLTDKKNQDLEVKVKTDGNKPTPRDEGETIQIQGKLNSNNIIVAESLEKGCKNVYK